MKPLSLEQQLELTIERRMEDATRILAHYAIQGRWADTEGRAEATKDMREVVSAIVDAASLRVQFARLGRHAAEQQREQWNEHVTKHDGYEVVELTPKDRDALEEETEYDHRMEFGMTYDQSDEEA